ncbi:MAG TPA: regulatory protein RecX [Puia sp.]|nr:regulatory protein RecX [Puia sp.]
MYRRTSLSPEQALQKARNYCSYQDRCHSEVREKLYALGLGKTQVGEALATLIGEDYLNEERFAINYAGGHFRMKQWGRNRIRYELKQKQVSEYCIRKALAAIDEDAYQRTLIRLSRARWDSLRDEDNPLARKRKWQTYLLQKGYESDRISALKPPMDERSAAKDDET